MKILIRSVLLILILSLLLPLSAVYAFPDIPHQFYGTVTLDGATAPDGTSVTAEVSGIIFSDSVSGGTYSITIQDQADDTIINAGDSISFFVDGFDAQNATFTPGGFTELNLSATSPPVQYTLTINTNGSGSASGAGTYTAGEDANISANPANGWEFDNWTGDTGTIANTNDPTTTITMDGDYTITANFLELPTYELTININGDGTASGDGTHYQGKEATINAYPASGWKFDDWSGDTGTIDDVNAATTKITMNSDYTITANFSEAEIFTLTIAVNGNGSTNPAVGEHEYQEGEVVNITAIPDEGWQFVSWSVGVADPNSASTTVTIDSDKTVTANFSPEGVTTYTLIISVNGQGATSPSEGTYTYSEGTVVDISANPASGWRFINWSGDTGTIDDINDQDITITMNGNYAITANFSELPQYTLKIDIDGEGSTSGAGTYYQGEKVSIRANPASGWVFVNWSGDTATIEDVNDSTTTITMDSDYTIIANFSEAEIFTLTVAVNGNGSTSPAVGEHEYEEGTVVNISAIPDQDWQFVNWSGGVDNPNSASTTITMDADKSVTANFSPFGITTYILTISINGNGTTKPSEGDHSYTKGKVVSITAIPEEGWYFDGWSGDTGTIANVNNQTTTITMNNDAEITVNFGREDDITAPVIPVVLAANITKTGADIFWITDEPGDSQVEYWASPGELTPLDTTLVTEHLVRLIELTPATTYHYKVMSKDEAGNLRVSDEYTFVTAGTAATFVTSDWETSYKELDAGKEVTINFLVTNIGDIAGSYQANLTINGEVEETRGITLAAAASQEVIFTINQNTIGTYVVTVDELALSFTIEPGGGINWWLIIGIIAGVLFIIVFCVLYILRRIRSKAEEIPRLQITEEETFEETEEKDFEEDISDGAEVTYFGLTVTALARLKLKEALQSKTKDPNKGFRITIPTEKPSQLKMIMDNEREGDQVVESDGVKILFLSTDLGPMLEGMIIDYHITPQGGGFSVSKLSLDE